MLNGDQNLWLNLECSNFIGIRSDLSLPMTLSKPSWSQSFSKLLHGFLQVDTRICQDCWMDLSRLSHVFLALCQTKATWSLKDSLSCHIDWSKLLCTSYSLPNHTKPKFDRGFSYHCIGMFVWSERGEVAWFFKLFIWIKQFTPGSVVPLALFSICGDFGRLYCHSLQRLFNWLGKPACTNIEVLLS